MQSIFIWGAFFSALFALSNSILVIINEKVTWDEAFDRCNAHPLFRGLAILDDPQLIKEATKVINEFSEDGDEYIWISGTNRDSPDKREYSWKISSTQSQSFSVGATNWADGQPLQHNRWDRCVAIRPSCDNVWEGDNCKKRFAYMCESAIRE